MEQDNSPTTNYLLDQVAKLIEDTAFMSSEIDSVFKNFTENLREIKECIESNKISIQEHGEQLRKLKENFIRLVKNYEAHKHNLSLMMKKLEIDVSKTVKKPRPGIIVMWIGIFGSMAAVLAFFKTIALALKDFFTRLFGG